jgi:hypothetical protein
MCQIGTPFKEESHMAQNDSGTPLGDGLFCHLEMSAEQSNRSLTVSGSGEPLHLNQQQTLALFRLLLGHLGQIARVELHQDSELYEVNLVGAFHRALDWLNSWSPAHLDETDSLQQAHEQYQRTYDLQDEMLNHVNAWELALEHQYSKLEDAAEELGMSFDELDEDFEDEQEDQS